MATGIYVTFYAGTAFYVVAAVLALLYLRQTEEKLLPWSSRALIVGVLFFLCAFALRWSVWGHLPLTTMTDSLEAFTVLATLAILFTVRRNGMPALLCFYVPPLTAIALVNAVFAPRFLPLEPRILRGSLLGVHVGLAFLAYALFFIASMTSAAYLFQSRHLKHHQTSGLFRHLPSLAELDTALFRLIGYGYPLFIVTLTLGLIWAFIDRDLVGKWWWLSPKVVLSYGMAGFYAVMFHLRRLGRLRGPKLAQLVCAGFFLMIAMYIVLSVLNLRVYHFWSNAS
jgi:HemX protein